MSLILTNLKLRFEPHLLNLFSKYLAEIQVLILFLLKKWISPTMLEIAKFGKKTQGILGVKFRKNNIIIP